MVEKMASTRYLLLAASQPTYRLMMLHLLWVVVWASFAPQAFLLMSLPLALQFPSPSALVQQAFAQSLYVSWQELAPQLSFQQDHYLCVPQ